MRCAQTARLERPRIHETRRQLFFLARFFFRAAPAFFFVAALAFFLAGFDLDFLVAEEDVVADFFLLAAFFVFFPPRIDLNVLVTRLTTDRTLSLKLPSRTSELIASTALLTGFFPCAE